MKTKIEVGKTYSVEQYQLTVTYINDIYFYGWARGRGNSHLHTGHIYIDSKGNEEIQLSFYTSEEMFQFTEEKVKSTVDGWALDRANKIQAKADAVLLAKEKDRKNIILSNHIKEAQTSKNALTEELRNCIISGETLKATMKDRRVKELLSELALINAILTPGVHTLYN